MPRALPVLVLLALLLGAADAPAAVSKRLSVAVPERAKLADGARLRVAVRVPRAGRYRLVVALRRSGARPLRAARATVRIRRAGRRTTRSLRLSAAARRRLGDCRAQRLSVRLVRRSGRTVARRSRSLRAACTGLGSPVTTTAPSSSGDGTGGGTNGTGGGGGTDAGAGTGGRPARQPVAPGFDTADFDRCDALDPAVCLQPFPSNHFLEGQGEDRRVVFDREAMPKNREGKPIEPGDYALNDGFSPGASLITRVPGMDTPEAFRATGAPAIDDPAASQAADSPVVVINTTTGARHLVWAELDLNAADPSRRNLIIRPGVNFAENTRYVVALRRMRRADGSLIPAGRAFEVFRDGIVTTDPKVEARRPQMEAIFGDLEKAGVRRDDLFLAWDFTVASAQSTTSRMLSIRDDAFAELGDTDLADLTVQGDAPEVQLLPDLPDTTPGTAELDGVRDFTPAQDDKIARRVRGRITVPCYLTNACENGGRFQFADARGRRPMRFGSTSQPFTCNIPRVALDGPNPRQVRPALYGHGLFGSQNEANGGPPSSFANAHGLGFCAVDWDGMAFEDVPTAAAILQDLSLFPLLTDHVQQGILNFLHLGRAMVHPTKGLSTLPAFRTDDGKPVFDTRRLFYDGNSQGGIYGATLAAVGVDHDRAVLGVPGMNYSTLLPRSVDFDMYAEGTIEGVETEAGLYDQYPDELQRPLILGLIQMLWDRSDPNGYAHHMTTDPLPNTPAHTVLLHPAFGDHQVADVAATVMARTVGAKLHTPVLENGRPRFRDLPYGPRPDRSFVGLEPLADGDPGSGMVIFDTGPLRAEGELGTPPPPAGNLPPREGNDPHAAPRRSPLGQAQKSAFLQVGGTIPDVCAGGPCFADGYAGAGG